MRTFTFTPSAPVMPAAWPTTNRVRPVKDGFPMRRTDRNVSATIWSH